MTNSCFALSFLGPFLVAGISLGMTTQELIDLPIHVFPNGNRLQLAGDGVATRHVLCLDNGGNDHARLSIARDRNLTVHVPAQSGEATPGT